MSVFIGSVVLAAPVLAKEKKAEESKPKKAKLALTIDGKDAGAIELTLFRDKAPKTVDNFIGLCQQKKYNEVPFHRIIPGFMAQGGDYENQNGTGGKSIYGDKFDDENLKDPALTHSKKGILSMANAGPNTNGSQFFITFAATTWLDGNHQVFGEVQGSSSIKTLDAMEAQGSKSGSTAKKVILKSCEPI